jgi:serine protease Do
VKEANNTGNSGGPLVNMAGEVIGINSVKIAEVGVEGMGYAISIYEAVPVIQELITTGPVIRPSLGIWKRG